MCFSPLILSGEMGFLLSPLLRCSTLCTSVRYVLTENTIFLLRFRHLHLVPCSGFLIHWTFLPSTHLAPGVDRLKPSPSETYVALLLMPPSFCPSDDSNLHIRPGDNSINKCFIFLLCGIQLHTVIQKPPNLGAHCLGKPRSRQK